MVLKPGDRFDNKELCMYAIGHKALIEGFEFKPRKSDPLRYDVVCVNKDCNWKIISSKLEYSDEWQLKTVYDYHTCTKTQVGMRHRNATAKLLGHLIEPKLKDSSRIYKGKDIQHDLNTEYNIDITYKQALRSRYAAVESIAGCPVASFAELPFYCHNLELTNDGTVTHIDTDEQHMFKMVFIAFGVSVQAFRYHMRPLLVIDAAHLKGPFKGTNLLAVGMDGNNQIVPIATGVSQSESAESWKWFLAKLKECIGENPELAIISDRHAGIISACAAVFPNAFHGYCCRHLMMNCKLKSEKLEAIYWRMCKAYSIEGFNNAIGELAAKRPKAYNKLIEAGVERWSRAHCTSNRYNYMTTNYAESVNSLTRHVRKLPVTNLMEWYRELVQNWFCDRRDKYKDATTDELSDWAEAKIKSRGLKSGNWGVKAIEKYSIYQVDDRRKIHTVELCNYTCTCRVWQLSGLPCGHVIAVYRLLELTDYTSLVQAWFRKTTLKSTYEGLVYPVGEESSWIRPNYLQLVNPPVIGKRPAGRPKGTNRIRSQGEEPVKVSCGRCGTRGHNRQGCREPLPNKKAKTSGNGSSQQRNGDSQQRLESYDNSMPYSFEAVNLNDP